MTTTLRSLIVDDEPLARELLRRMLGAHDDVEVVGECASGTQAVEEIRATRPDLIFLDVQMPGLDGFAVLSELAPDIPEVVFVTAYDQYALRAFDVHALDYLLKPFDEERLARAIDRARAHLRRPDAGGDRRQILALLEELRGGRAYRERLVIRVGERAFLQPVADIDWLEADGKYVKVHAGPKTYIIRETMTQLAEVLDPRRFLRISRSAIVNVDRIREIQPWFRGDYVVIMQNGAEVTSTRGYRDTLKALLNGEA
ncbi:MAG TPA: LytTR family DNA-binding domain-containing protein [Longimicrobium sp.]